MANKTTYQPTIGIECHVQLNTRTKLFAAVGNDAKEAPPNSLISHICLGMPGALPVLNERAVELAARMAFALNTKPQKYSFFERKHYFYPDLPKGYQISQLSQPIIKGGQVDIVADGKSKTVHINRVQIEEDAGKNTHPNGKDYSLVDLNRAGTPLLEIVSEPDIDSASEAKAYARELYLLVRYANVSDADLFHGNMRFDVNVSLSPDSELGTRTETKNLNSFRSVEKAVEYEIKRQSELLDKGEMIVQETRGWDDAKQKTFSQRGKEEAHDYRYMPEPDVPPIELDDKYISKVEKAMPEMPSKIRQALAKFGLNAKVVEEILDNMAVYRKIERAIAEGASPETARRIAYDSLEKPETLVVSVSDHIKIADSFQKGDLNATSALISLLSLVDDPHLAAEEVIAKNAQNSDSAELEKEVKKVIEANPGAAEDVRRGEHKAIGFLVGQVMQATKGQANPQLVQAIIKKQLS